MTELYHTGARLKTRLVENQGFRMETYRKRNRANMVVKL
jgi:hypothetical protein